MVQGQLGSGDTFAKNVPSLIAGFSGRGVVQVSCGYQHTVALTATGNVLACGSNEVRACVCVCGPKNVRCSTMRSGTHPVPLLVFDSSDTRTLPHPFIVLLPSRHSCVPTHPYTCLYSLGN